MKNVECPSCLGNKKIFDPEEDKMINCNFCKGKGNVDEDKADLYDPITYEITLDFDYTYLSNEEEYE